MADWQITGPDDAYRAIHNIIKAVRSEVTAMRDRSAIDGLTRRESADLSVTLRDARVALQNQLAVSGLDAYARAVKGASFDIAAEVGERITAINNLQSWICGPTDANPTPPAGSGQFPTAGAQNVLAEKVWGPDGAWVLLPKFTVAQTAPFRTQCNAFLAGLVT